MRQKVALIQPPLEDFYATAIRRQPLGLLYMAGALRQAGHEVELINGHTPKQKVIPWPKEFAYLKPYLKKPGPEAFPFSNYYHFGMSYEALERLISKSSARIFFVSALFTTYFEEVNTVIGFIKKHHPGAILVLGGYQAALHPEYYLGRNVDYVITGEGEIASVLLLGALEGKISLGEVPGLCYIKNGQFIRQKNRQVENLDRLSFPARDLLLSRDLKVYKRKMVSMIASRGCPHGCVFCSGRTIWERTYRRRSPENIYSEMKELLASGVDWFNFEDDNLFLLPDQTIRLLGIFRELKKHHPALELTAMNGLSIEHLDHIGMRDLREAGFGEINLSLVSAGEDYQRELARPFKTSLFEKIVRDAKKEGMKVRAYFILGLPGQTKEEVRQTISYLKRLEVTIYPSVYYDVFAPVLEWKTQRSSAFFNETEFLSREDLICFFNQAHEK